MPRHRRRIFVVHCFVIGFRGSRVARSHLCSPSTWILQSMQYSFCRTCVPTWIAPLAVLPKKDLCCAAGTRLSFAIGLRFHDKGAPNDSDIAKVLNLSVGKFEPTSSPPLAWNSARSERDASSLFDLGTSCTGRRLSPCHWSSQSCHQQSHRDHGHSGSSHD